MTTEKSTPDVCHCGVCKGRPNLPAHGTRPVSRLHEVGAEAIAEYRKLTGQQDAPAHIMKPLGKPRIHNRPPPPPVPIKRAKRTAVPVPQFATVQDKVNWINARKDISPGMKSMQVKNLLKKAPQ